MNQTKIETGNMERVKEIISSFGELSSKDVAVVLPDDIKTNISLVEASSLKDLLKGHEVAVVYAEDMGNTETSKNNRTSGITKKIR